MQMTDLTREEITNPYNQFIKELDCALLDKDYKACAKITDIYLDYAKEREANSKIYLNKENTNIFGDKTKYYSSILEELPIHLIKEEILRIFNDENKSSGLVLGGQICLIRQGITPDMKIFSETKNIDFCFASLVRGGNGVFVPFYGLEVKKYMDKTMFGTVIDTVRSLSVLRPKTKYGFLIEEEARSSDVIQNSPIHESEFVLSGSNRVRKGRLTIKPEMIENLHFTLVDWTRRAARDIIQ